MVVPEKASYCSKTMGKLSKSSKSALTAQNPAPSIVLVTESSSPFHGNVNGLPVVERNPVKVSRKGPAERILTFSGERRCLEETGSSESTRTTGTRWRYDIEVEHDLELCDDGPRVRAIVRFVDGAFDGNVLDEIRTRCALRFADIARKLNTAADA